MEKVIEIQKKYSNVKEGEHPPFVSIEWTNYLNALNEKGICLDVIGEVEKALECFEQMTLIDPKCKYGWVNVASMLFKLDREYDKGLAFVEKAIEIDPDYFTSWDAKSLMLYKFKRYREAVECSNIAIKLNPDDANCYFNRACYNALLGENSAALNDLETAIRLDPHYRESAIEDDSFKGLSGNAEFKKILGLILSASEDTAVNEKKKGVCLRNDLYLQALHKNYHNKMVNFAVVEPVETTMLQNISV